MIREITLNPDGTLNVLNGNKIYFLVAHFRSDYDPSNCQLYLNKLEPSREQYGFFRVSTIDNNNIVVLRGSAFEDKYQQYSIYKSLHYQSEYYSKKIYECDSQEEFIKHCIENQKLYNIAVK